MERTMSFVSKLVSFLAFSAMVFILYLVALGNAGQ
jgi:hypothetical protein